MTLTSSDSVVTQAMIGDLIGRLRDDSALCKERWAGCKKIGDTNGMLIASQIADDLDEAAYYLNRWSAAIADEREACAKVAEFQGTISGCKTRRTKRLGIPREPYFTEITNEIAAAIRSRSVEGAGGGLQK